MDPAGEPKTHILADQEVVRAWWEAATSEPTTCAASSRSARQREPSNRHRLRRPQVVGSADGYRSFHGTSPWVSPRFQERHPDAPVDHVIGPAAPDDWGGQIRVLSFGGSRFLDEVVFYHERSRTLILTDLIQRHDPSEESWFWRHVKRAAGVLGESGGTARDLRSTFTDRVAARKSAEALLRWDFDRVIIAHGMCITKNARRTVEQAFDWALQA